MQTRSEFLYSAGALALVAAAPSRTVERARTYGDLPLPGLAQFLSEFPGGIVIVRPEDLSVFYLATPGFEIIEYPTLSHRYKLWATGSAPKIVVELPPQHFLEETTDELSPGTLPRILAAHNSRLVFDFTQFQHLSYDLPSILEQISVTRMGIADTPPVGATGIAVDAGITAIEFPYRLVLSPHATSQFRHEATARALDRGISSIPHEALNLLRSRRNLLAVRGRNLELADLSWRDIWHSRLKEPSQQGAQINEHDGTLSQLRALSSLGTEDGAFVTILDKANRDLITKLTVSRTQEQFDARAAGAIEAKTFILSSMGATVGLEFANPKSVGASRAPSQVAHTKDGITVSCKPLTIDLSHWSHQASLGRDHFGQVTYIFFSRYGHKCSLVETTERVVLNGRAELHCKTTIKIGVPSVQLSGEDARACGFTSIVLSTGEVNRQETPPINPVFFGLRLGLSNDEFAMRPAVTDADNTPQPYLFNVCCYDWAGQLVKSEKIPLEFLSEWAFTGSSDNGKFQSDYAPTNAWDAATYADREAVVIDPNGKAQPAPTLPAVNTVVQLFNGAAVSPDGQKDAVSDLLTFDTHPINTPLNFLGQQVTIADVSAVLAPGKTNPASLFVQRLQLDCRVRVELVDGKITLAFRPRMRYAEVASPAVRHLAGVDAKGILRMYERYVIEGLKDQVNYVFASFPDTSVLTAIQLPKLDPNIVTAVLTGASSQIRSKLADASNRIVGLSAQVGAVVGAGAAAVGTAREYLDAMQQVEAQVNDDVKLVAQYRKMAQDPRQLVATLLEGQAPKLFNLIDLSSILPLKFFDAGVQAMVPILETKEILDELQVPKEIEARYIFSAKLHSGGSGIATLSESTNLTIVANAHIPLSPGKQSTRDLRITVGVLPDSARDVKDQLPSDLRNQSAVVIEVYQNLFQLHVDRAEFFYSADGALHASIAGLTVKPGSKSAVALIEQLLQQLSPPGTGPFIDFLGDRLVAGFRLALGPFALGAFSISSLSVGTDVRFPIFGDNQFSACLSIGTYANPFVIAFAFLGGGGSFTLDSAYGLDGGFHVGAYAALSLGGIVSGSVHADASLYYVSPVELQVCAHERDCQGARVAVGGLSVGGHADVLSLASMDLDFDAQLAYCSQEGTVEAHAQIYVDIHLFLFDFSETLPYDFVVAVSSQHRCNGSPAAAVTRPKRMRAFKTAAPAHIGDEPYFMDKPTWHAYTRAFA